MFGDPYSNDLERWEIAAKIEEKEARGCKKEVFWKRPRVIIGALLCVFAAAGIRGAFVDDSVNASSRLSMQTAGFNSGAFAKTGGFGMQNRMGRNAEFSKLVLRTPDAAAWPELDRERREDGRALVRRMLQERFSGDWKFLRRDLRKTLDAAVSQASDWNVMSLHWSHTHSGNARMLQAYHKRVRGIEGGMAYHFVIGNGNGDSDGGITIGRRWEDGVASGAAVAPGAVSICLIGNGEPTPNQEAALRELVIYLEAKVGELVAR